LEYLLILGKFIEDQFYGGATNYQALSKFLEEKRVFDWILLFTDGISTFGSSFPTIISQYPLYIFSVSQERNVELLEEWASSGGKFFDCVESKFNSRDFTNALLSSNKTSSFLYAQIGGKVIQEGKTEVA